MCNLPVEWLVVDMRTTSGASGMDYRLIIILTSTYWLKLPTSPLYKHHIRNIQAKRTMRLLQLLCYNYYEIMSNLLYPPDAHGRRSSHPSLSIPFISSSPLDANNKKKVVSRWKSVVFDRFDCVQLHQQLGGANRAANLATRTCRTRDTSTNAREALLDSIIWDKQLFWIGNWLHFNRYISRILRIGCNALKSSNVKNLIIIELLEC